MTVEQANVIDFLATRENTVRLVVSDHLPWDDELHHLLLLQEKLNAYLAFVEGGQLVEEYPEHNGKRVEIHVAFLHAPTEHARNHFLSKTESTIQRAGFGFSWSKG